MLWVFDNCNMPFTTPKTTSSQYSMKPFAAFGIRQLTLGVLMALLFLLSLPAHAQTQYATQQGTVKVLGTSTLHDWSMQSDKGQCNAAFLVQNEEIKSLKALTFSVPVTTLHSEHNGLDKNAYNALNAEKYDKISFALTSAEEPVRDRHTFIIACKGNLSISGVTKPAMLEATCKLNSDKSITCTGFYLMKMTAHNVQPPKLMMGTIKTGDDIHIDFNVTLKP